MNRLLALIVWIAWKLSGKRREHFYWLLNFIYFFNRSVLCSAWLAMIDRGEPPRVSASACDLGLPS